MSKQDSESPAAVSETSAELPSGAPNTKERQMENENTKEQSWPKGLFVIFIKSDTEASMGQVIGLTQTKALIHPWNFMYGGLDVDLTLEVVLADHEKFISFDDWWKMDDYFMEHFWTPALDKNIKMGAIV